MGENDGQPVEIYLNGIRVSGFGPADFEFPSITRTKQEKTRDKVRHLGLYSKRRRIRKKNRKRYQYLPGISWLCCPFPIKIGTVCHVNYRKLADKLRKDAGNVSLKERN